MNTSTVHCGWPGCQRTALVQIKHLDNLMARGGWWCHQHDDDKETE